MGDHVFFGIVLTHILDALGVLYIVLFAVKAARGYPFLRWFY